MADKVTAPAPVKAFERPPEDEYQACCVDVVDLGLVFNPTWDKDEHKIALVFQLDQLDSTGKFFEVAERFTLSMGEKARLRKFLEDWRGRKYKEDELAKGVPIDKLVGQFANIKITHNVVGEKTYANIFQIRALGKKETPFIAKGYERSPRWAENMAKTKQAPPPEPAFIDFPPAMEDEDDDLPF